MSEALTAETYGVSPSLGSRLVGRQTTVMQRGWRLRYSVVTTAECNSMAAFFTARRGAFDEFMFHNPNDGELYRARFDTGMSIDYFTPGYLRFGEIVMAQITGW